MQKGRCPVIRGGAILLWLKINKTSICLTTFLYVLQECWVRRTVLTGTGRVLTLGTRAEAGERWSVFSFYILAWLPFVSVSTVHVFLFQKTINQRWTIGIRNVKQYCLYQHPPKNTPEVLSYTSNKTYIRWTPGTLPNSDERNHRLKWRANPCSQLGTLSIVKISVLPNLTYRFNMIPMKIPTRYFVNINPLILNFMWTGKRLRMVDTAGKEENKGGGLLVWSIS